MSENAGNIEHKFAKIASIQVPFIKCVTNAAIKTMMDKDMGCREVPGDIAEEHSNDILENVAKALSYPLSVKCVIMPLYVAILMRKVSN
jgi:hypothetical protein